MQQTLSQNDGCTLIKNARIFTLDDQNRVIGNGHILVLGNRIAHVGESLPNVQAETVVDAGGNIVMPGFCNAHTHLPMSLLRGAGEDLPLMDWLHQRIFPLEDRLDDSLAYLGAMVSLVEMIRTGTTSLVDMYFFCDGIAKAICESGMRANLSRCVVGPDLAATRSPMAEALRIYDNWNGAAEGRVQVGFSIQGEYIAGLEVMGEVARLARERNALLQVHVSETQGEHQACQERHGGKTPFEVLEKTGFLNGRVVAAHCVWITDADMDIIKDRDVWVATCPKSNLKLGSGVARAAAMLEKGVKVALGTDGAASNNNLDMLDEMRYMALLQKGSNRDPRLMSIADCLRIAVRNGASAMDAGSGVVAEGGLADLIMIDTKSTRFLPRENADAHLLYSATGSDVCMTMIDGRIVYRDGKILFCDEDALAEEFAGRARKLYAYRREES